MHKQVTEEGVSVVICTRNGKIRLKPVLDSILCQSFSALLSWELIIVDNASTDGTAEFCENYLRGYHGLDWQVIREAKPGLGNARLAGLYSSRYDLILFCDDDNHLFPDYVELGNNYLRTHEEVGALGGFGIPLFLSEKPIWFEQFSHSYAVGPQAKTPGVLGVDEGTLYGAGCFFRKQLLVSFLDRGFKTVMSDRTGANLSSGGDVEWCHLVQLSGYQLAYSEDLKFYHEMPGGRLTWTYYLQLKSGIAAGNGLLKPYRFLLRSGTGSFHFVCSYLNDLLLSQLVAVKFFLRSVFTTPGHSNDHLQLAKLVVYSKAASYRKNFIKAWFHFRQIKRIRNAIF